MRRAPRRPPKQYTYAMCDACLRDLPKDDMVFCWLEHATPKPYKICVDCRSVILARVSN